MSVNNPNLAPSRGSIAPGGTGSAPGRTHFADEGPMEPTTDFAPPTAAQWRRERARRAQRRSQADPTDTAL